MIKSIIVEDDPSHSDRLVKLLKKIDVPIEILSVNTNVEATLTSINEYRPELIFLDIELEGSETGFDLLKKIEVLDFDVIFTTSHTNINNAIAAIRACALDFLPKPLIITELERAVKRFMENKKIGIEQVKTLKANLELNNFDDRLIWIATGSHYVKVEINNIIYCESDNEVVHFFLQTAIEGKLQHTSSKSIGEWEKILEHSQVCRIHNQFLVNLKHVVTYTRGDGGLVKMSNGKGLPVSKARKETLLKRLGLK